MAKHKKRKKKPVLKVDTYLGGESDVGDHLPAKFENFFSKKKLFIILFLLVLMLVLTELLKNVIK